MKCQYCETDFDISESEDTLRMQVSPSIGTKKAPLQAPKHCPDCRRLIRLSFRNDQNYYRTNCKLCETSIVSIYSPDKPFPVYCHDCYWSEKWDPLSYGVPYSPDQDFFEQFARMRRNVPRVAIYNTLSQNCDYTVHSSHNKDCYLCSSTINCESCLYCDMVFRSTDSVDCHRCWDCELCYDCRFCNDCFDCEHLTHCLNCNNSSYCFDCRSSENLIGCVGLRQKKFMVLNQAVTAEQLAKIRLRLREDIDFRRGFAQRFEKLVQAHVKPAFWNTSAEDSLGNYLTNCKELYSCFEVGESESAWHTVSANRVVNAMDCNRCGSCEMLYNCHGNIDLTNSICCNLCYQCDHLMYCDNCQSGTSQCFGCVGLKKHSYCILNTQYSKSEYERIALQIYESIRTEGKWGQFFDPSLSPFSYTESRAHEQMPLAKEQAEALGWNYSDYDSPPPPQVTTASPGIGSVPIAEVDDSILKQAISCEDCSKPFRITKAELSLYRKKGIFLPSKCPQDRHRTRLATILPYQLFQRECPECSELFHTSYPPLHSDTVFCQSCYLARMY